MTDNATNSPRPNRDGGGAEGRDEAKGKWRKEVRARRRERRAREAMRASMPEAAQGAIQDPTAPRTSERAALASHIDEVPGLSTARTVTSFEPLPTEPDVSGLNAALTARGVRVLVPITCADLDLEWRVLGDPGAGSLGKNAIAEADVVIVPALAVSERGERLGQGGGSYDRALPRRADQATVVAVVFADDVVPELPTEPHDERVDAALTEQGVQLFR